MKTFDEAFDIILQRKKDHPEVFEENFKSGVEYINNDKWKEMLVELSNDTLPPLCGLLVLGLETSKQLTTELDAQLGPATEGTTRMAISGEVTNQITNMLCSALHRAYQMGLLTGIEMEKPE